MGGRTALFEDEAKPEWKEGALELPPLPFEKDLIPFHVSSNASAAFYVDGRSLRLGDDGIVGDVTLDRGELIAKRADDRPRHHRPAHRRPNKT